MEFDYILLIEPLLWSLGLGAFIGGVIGGLAQRPRVALIVSIVYGLLTAFVAAVVLFLFGAAFFSMGGATNAEIFNLTGLVIFLGTFVAAFLMHGLPVIFGTWITCWLLGKRTK